MISGISRRRSGCLLCRPRPSPMRGLPEEEGQLRVLHESENCKVGGGGSGDGGGGTGGGGGGIGPSRYLPSEGMYLQGGANE